MVVCLLFVSAHYVSCHLTARVALVKCRDLHWAMMAHKDQRDTNLSTIRMLIVADGANPCESHPISFTIISIFFFFWFADTLSPHVKIYLRICLCN